MSAYEKMKDVLRVARDIQNLELLKQLNELQNEVFELDTLNRDLRARLKELEDELSLREQLVFKKNVYWHVTDAGSEEGPYCPRCFDREQSPRHLTIHRDPQVYVCPSCLFMVTWEGGDLQTGVRARFLRAFTPDGKLSLR